jgi:hypothetical protein
MPVLVAFKFAAFLIEQQLVQLGIDLCGLGYSQWLSNGVQNALYERGSLRIGDDDLVGVQLPGIADVRVDKSLFFLTARREAALGDHALGHIVRQRQWKLLGTAGVVGAANLDARRRVVGERSTYKAVTGTVQIPQRTRNVVLAVVLLVARAWWRLVACVAAHDGQSLIDGDFRFGGNGSYLNRRLVSKIRGFTSIILLTPPEWGHVKSEPKS